MPDKYIAVVFVNGDDPGTFLQNQKNIYLILKGYLMDMINLYIKILEVVYLQLNRL
ncbi:MAG: hypothetical protein IPG53_22985 [Ignavibacteriales bacterium]|nr:hypothetical protein [Ignavibacteriales bacterium]